VLHEPEADTASLPRTYASIRRCVRDLRSVGGDVYATVEGRDVLTGESRTVSGLVTETRFEETGEVATMVLETDDGRVEVGGRVAALEDIEAHEIAVGRGEPPQL
jgi:hypothetical protein